MRLYVAGLSLWLRASLRQLRTRQVSAQELLSEARSATATKIREQCGFGKKSDAYAEERGVRAIGVTTNQIVNAKQTCSCRC